MSTTQRHGTRGAGMSAGRAIAIQLGRGLAVILPIGATLWLMWWAFVALEALIPTDRLVGRHIPGLGLVLLGVLAMVTGLVATIPAIRRLILRGEVAVVRVPLVGLCYSTIRDFVNAFGAKKRFDKPVIVNTGADGEAGRIGFVTRDNLEALGILDKVAVYLPWAFNVGGIVLILPRGSVTPLDADAAAVMTFVMTGGVASADAPGELRREERCQSTPLAPECRPESEPRVSLALDRTARGVERGGIGHAAR